MFYMGTALLGVVIHSMRIKSIRS